MRIPRLYQVSIYTRTMVVLINNNLPSICRASAEHQEFQNTDKRHIKTPECRDQTERKNLIRTPAVARAGTSAKYALDARARGSLQHALRARARWLQGCARAATWTATDRRRSPIPVHRYTVRTPQTSPYEKVCRRSTIPYVE